MCVQRSSSHISSEQQRNLVLAREKKVSSHTINSLKKPFKTTWCLIAPEELAVMHMSLVCFCIVSYNILIYVISVILYNIWWMCVIECQWIGNLWSIFFSRTERLEVIVLPIAGRTSSVNNSLWSLPIEWSY